ncbi:MAG TPA: beta-galactosidase [Bacteroidota bacterium]|nr:beta-galactosidase [Bacteroidota bacterium]
MAALGVPRAVAQTASPATNVLTIDAAAPPAPPETGWLEMGSDTAGRSPGGSTLSVNSRYLVMDGKPWLPAMGEFHFSRCPRRFWEEELLKMKAGGVSIVSTYIFWIHHEEVEGRFDWSGERDLRAFVRLCNRLGLCVYPRIGPWAHGEARNGGLPDWLLAKGPTRVDDSTFLFHVRRLYNEIGKQLVGLLWKEGGPVIGVQIENEYSNRGPGGGEAYLLTLKRMAIDAGLDVPLYTITGWDNAVLPPRAFIPVYGGYPDEAWSGSRGELPPDPQGVFQFHVGTPVGTAGITHGAMGPAPREAESRYPNFTAELGGGMEDTYHRRVVIAPDDIAAMAVSALGSGVNLLGYYMFHGGTNPDGALTTLEESQETGYPNDVPVKSYDFQAPLGEFGEMTASFRALKPIHQFINDFGGDLALTRAVLPDRVPSGPHDTSTIRVSARVRANSGFLFINNYLRHYPLPAQPGVQIRVRLSSGVLAVPGSPCSVPAQSSFIWPFNLDMRGALLEYATAQPLARLSARADEYYFFTASPFPDAEFVFVSSTYRSLRALSGSLTRSGERTIVRGVMPSRSDAIVVTAGNGTIVHIVLLSRQDACNSWKARLGGHDRMLISAADLFWDSDTIHLRSREPGGMACEVFPDFDGVPRSASRLRGLGRDGIFARYAIRVTPSRLSVSAREVRPPGVVPPVAMGPYYDWRKCAVARAPDDSTFASAGLWRLALPGSLPPGVAGLFLRIDYAGDVARLFRGARLLDDNFFNGTAWEIGLDRLPGGAPALDLEILPLRADAPVYIPASLWPDFHGAAQIASIRSVSLVPEYEAAIAVAGAHKTSGGTQ